MKRGNKFIGIFDSGFGGIDILRGIVKELPNYNYIYLGDTARTPYGTRSSKIVYEFSRQAVNFLFKQKCELIIFACNTASSEALRKIQEEYLPKYYPYKKVLGVLIPAAEEAILHTKNGRVGILATEGTVESKTFVTELKKKRRSVKVFQQVCPLLVSLVESGENKQSFVKLILRSYIEPLKDRGIDTLILGCTHYGILETEIRKILGPNISIISERKVVPKKLKDYLERHTDIECNIGREGVVKFYTTDLTDKFIKLGSKFFGKKIIAHKATLT